LDKLRQIADYAELTRAAGAVELTIKRLLATPSPAALEIIPDLVQALQILRCNEGDCSCLVCKCEAREIAD
jgi:hypothetical protein